MNTARNFQCPTMQAFDDLLAAVSKLDINFTAARSDMSIYIEFNDPTNGDPERLENILVNIPATVTDRENFTVVASRQKDLIDKMDAGLREYKMQVDNLTDANTNLMADVKHLAAENDDLKRRNDTLSYMVNNGRKRMDDLLGRVKAIGTLINSMTA